LGESINKKSLSKRSEISISIHNDSMLGVMKNDEDDKRASFESVKDSIDEKNALAILTDHSRSGQINHNCI
jgi:hypothetical protein